MVVGCEFDSGNIVVEDASDPAGAGVKLRVRKDVHTELEKRSHLQWFHFKASGVSDGCARLLGVCVCVFKERSDSAVLLFCVCRCRICVCLVARVYWPCQYVAQRTFVARFCLRVASFVPRPLDSLSLSLSGVAHLPRPPTQDGRGGDQV